MSEGSRRCYHKIWTWGVKTGCLCLALLHSVAFPGGGEDSPQRARGAQRGEGFRRGKRAAPPRSSAALSFEGRFQTCPYHRPGGDDSPQRARGAQRGNGGIAGDGQPQGLPLRWVCRVGVAKKGGNVAWCCMVLHFRLLLSCRGDSRIAPTGRRGDLGGGKEQRRRGLRRRCRLFVIREGRGYRPSRSLFRFYEPSSTQVGRPVSAASVLAAFARAAGMQPLKLLPP